MGDPATDRLPSSDPVELATFELTVDRVAKGGASLGLGPDGRVVFVEGAIPGERVEVEVVKEHKRRIEARMLRVIDASPDRQEPPCRHVADGCGGCDWQHVAPAAQGGLRREVVADALRRLGRLEDVEIRVGPELPAEAYRTTVRAAVVDGRAAFRKRESHDLVVVDQCVIAHPLVEELLVESHFGDATEVTIRVGARTGERLVVVDGDPGSVTVPTDVHVVRRASGAEGSAGNPSDHHDHHHDHHQDRKDDHSRSDHGHAELHEAHIHEVVGGIRFQISASSFFQSRPDGAEMLGRLVADAIADAPGTLLDAYCGVGLFGALAGTGRRVLGIEANPIAAHDASHNLGPHSEVVTSVFERWSPQPVGVAVADPARAGLKAAGCDVLVAAEPDLIALVSCDPASLARDAGLLVERGYQLDWVTVVDLFGHTSHVETVSRFSRR